MKAPTVDSPPVGAPAVTGARPAPVARPFAARYQSAIAALEGAPHAADGSPSPGASVTVNAGDTLWSLVRQQLDASGGHASDAEVQGEVRRVAAVNRLDHPDLILPGDRIQLDASGSRATPASAAGPVAADVAAPAVAPPPTLEPGDVRPIPALIDGHADRVTSLFGMRNDPLCGKRRFHAGVDVAAVSGTPARAAASGVVSFAGEQSGYGRMVVVDHGGGVSTVYAHASALLVQAGDQVNAGTEIIRVGQSGRATGPHLHFELRKDGVAVDPRQLGQLLPDPTNA
jgi:murein DD-endopeptidase MepM/ murein hydrolase activator NlpD